MATTPSRFILVLLLILGVVLTLAGAGVIGLAAGQLRSPPAVLMAVGLLLGMSALLGFFPPGREGRGSGFRFAVAVTVSSATLLAVLMAWYSHDEQLAIGPFVFRGAAVDRFGKVLLGINATLLAVAAVWCWRSWWRQLGRRP